MGPMQKSPRFPKDSSHRVKPRVAFLAFSARGASRCHQHRIAASGLTRYKFRYMKPVIALLAVLLLCQISTAQTSRPVPQVNRVLIISIDGLRPDVMLRARTPNQHRLFETGAFSFWAQTVPTANTLPSHTSMLTGVSVETHGINFNDERATTRPIYPNAPTLFELAKRNGYTTAMVAGKAKFAALVKPGTIDWASAPLDPKTTDANVADHA